MNGNSVSTIGKYTKNVLGGAKDTFNKLPGGKFGKTVGAFTAMDIYSNVQSGDDMGTALVKAGAQHIYWSMAPTVAAVTTFAPMLGQAAYGVGKFAHNKQQWWNQQFRPSGVVGGNYVDTQRAQTMRQAAVQAIQGSKLNARSALGGEAKIMSQYGPWN